jgi:hypothetical protein
MKRLPWYASLLLLVTLQLSAQDLPVNPELLKGPWKSSWISVQQGPQRDYGVCHFRKTIELVNKPEKYIIHVSADNRYRLFVNGRAVCSGPARGDLYNWNFETVDIGPYLRPGRNVLAALVWNMGVYAPVAQVSNQTGLVVQGNTNDEKAVNTDRSWKVYINKAYQPCSIDNGQRLHTYMVIGPGDHVKAANYPWGWEQPDFNDDAWQPAVPVAQPVPVGHGTDNLWCLVPRSIPLMEETPQRLLKIRRAEGVTPADGFLAGGHPITIPANKKVSILIDQTFNTVAYPELTVSKGDGSSIKMTYAEALFNNRKKGNRNEVEGREIMGNYDIFEPDGGNKRLFRPLWVRTYRYLQLDINTGKEPLVLENLQGSYTGYPFVQKASFSSNDTSLKAIWDVGWRTARLCAGETYFDCPYYEQLQYEGDTRIQSLISLYVAGDDRLMRKAIHDFYCSRVPEGLTQGRYPSNRLQVIPPFSLYWVSMVYDYWMHRKDDAFVQQYFTALRGVLDWYEKHIDPAKNMLGPMNWWGFVDWNHAFPNGVPDGATDGNSSVISLQYAYTLRQAAALFAGFGRQQEAQHYERLAAAISEATYKLCFDEARNEMANTPARNTFSQHAGIIAVLAGAIPADKEKTVLQRVMQDSTLSQATFYYRFYLNQALKKAGMAEMYYEQLKPWRDMLDMGLTTFAENPEPTRSDCHAWSASPNYDFLATICGIMPDKPGFTEVKIQPAMGALQQVSGTMPHPLGDITVNLTRTNGTGISAEVTLPPGLSGRFIWNGSTTALKEGKQNFLMKN